MGPALVLMSTRKYLCRVWVFVCDTTFYFVHIVPRFGFTLNDEVIFGSNPQTSLAERVVLAG